jgi:hypothetical protein
MFGLFKKHKPVCDPSVSGATVVYMRDLWPSRPARHWESPVIYDDWGNAFAYDYQFGKKAVQLKVDGQYGCYAYQQWKHKSGPAVNFDSKNGDPKTSWFPKKNPNDDLPL